MVTDESEVIRKVVSRKLRMGEGNNELDGEPNRMLKTRHHCGLMIKIGLTALSVGTVMGSDNGHCYPKISLDGRVVVGEKPTQNHAWPDLEPGMAVAASSGTGKATSVIPTEAVFPALSVKWRQETTTATEAAEYIGLRRRMGEFSVENIQHVMIAGATLVSAAGGLVGTARQIQLIRFRELRHAREFAE